ncbi:hypothetical protein RJD39_11030 [Vibrio scophthalmi]|uniref:hypothetical protein n=1 Tax=Vibrio scophthalmi TaxID=45658 RepID=UPI0038733470
MMTEQDFIETDINADNIYDFEGVEVVCHSEECKGELIVSMRIVNFDDYTRLECPCCNEVFCQVWNGWREDF